MDIIHRIESKAAKIGIIGLGYVGFPLAIAFARKGFHVTGFDVDPDKVSQLNEGKSYIKHIPSEAIREIMKAGKFHPTSDFRTGWWQIHGRSRVKFDESVEMDIWYLEHQSLVLDICNMLRTITKATVGRGAC